MHAITIEVNENVLDKIKWLLDNLEKKNEIRIIEDVVIKSDTEYLSSIPNLVKEISDSRKEPFDECVKSEDLKW